MPDCPRVAIVGTFDVENFGDLLFPLLAERELAARLPGLELLAFSYHPRHAPPWPYDVQSLTRLADLVPSLDLLIVGGGHLIRFDKHVAPDYGPPVSTIHHPTGYWLMPTLLASWSSVPVAWNALGASGGTPGWALPLLADAARSAAYVSVRDRQSADELRTVAPGVAVHTVPDTAFGVAGLLDEVTAREGNRLRSELGLEGPYAIVQPSRDFLDRRDWVHALAASIRDKGWSILELPISPGLGDAPGLLGLEPTFTPRGWPGPLQLLELIRGAEAVVARSLHLTIAASCFGVPAYRHPDDFGGKYEVVHGLPGVHISSGGKLGDGSAAADAPTDGDRSSQLAEHWDRIAQLVDSPRVDRREPLQTAIGRLTELSEETAERSAINATLQEALGRREEELEQARLEVAARVADLAASSRQLETQSGVLASIRAEGDALRASVAALRHEVTAMQASRSWRLTRPVRSIDSRIRAARSSAAARAKRPPTPAPRAAATAEPAAFGGTANSGYCAICMKHSTFAVEGPWLRDQYTCQVCHTIPRQRAVVSVLDLVRPDWRRLEIHESSPSLWFFRDQCHSYSYSYFFDEVPRGERRDGPRSEDLERLTFPDESFDVFITQDVLEHVFDPAAALREISRVLREGGIHIFTAPIHRSIPASYPRAKISEGRVTHLHEPQFHGNPISAEGSLVTWDYGVDFAELATRWSGYVTSTYLIRDRRLGIDGEHLEVFVTSKHPVNSTG